MMTDKPISAANAAEMNYSHIETLNDYMAERVSELVIDSYPGASALMKSRAIMHRQDAAELAKKNGATLDDLQKTNDLAQRTVAMSGDSDYLVFFENDGFQVYQGSKPFGCNQPVTHKTRRGLAAAPGFFVTKAFGLDKFTLSSAVAALWRLYQLNISIAAKTVPMFSSPNAS